MTKFGSSLTILQVGADVGDTPVAPASDTFTAIAQVQTIGGPSLSKGQIDATTLDNAAKEFIADLPEPGTLDMTLLFDAGDTQHALLFGDANAVRRKRNWRLIIPDQNATQTTPSQMDFVAEVVSWNNSFDQGAVISAEVSLQISGNPTLTPRS